MRGAYVGEDVEKYRRRLLCAARGRGGGEGEGEGEGEAGINKLTEKAEHIKVGPQRSGVVRPNRQHHD